MIGSPINDAQCLGILHEHARKDSQHPVIVELAQAFHSTAEIAAFLRTRPRSYDVGNPLDGPRVPCRPTQRLRTLPEALNCFEGTNMYLSLAEAKDPATTRTSMTIRVGRGYHTFPVEHDRPVILDSIAPRNAMHAGLHHCRADSTRAITRPTSWLASIARKARYSPCDAARIGNGLRALRSGKRYDPRNIAILLAVAQIEARLWGPDGTAAYEQAAVAIRRHLQHLDLGCFPSHLFTPQ